MIKKNGKYIVNILFMFALLGVTYYLLFRGQELSDITIYIKMAKNRYLYLGIACVVAFVCSESLIIHQLMVAVRQRVPMLNCIKYSFIGFFFSAVTPSASGGQPMQIYYMNKDGIDVPISSVVLIIVTAMYKIVLILLCTIFGIMNWTFISTHISSIWFLVMFGVVCNVLFVIFLLIAIFKQSFARKMIGGTLLWLRNRHIIKHYDRWLRKLLSALKRYEASATYIKKNKRVLLYSFIITLVQRLMLFAVTYLVYKAFSLKGNNAAQIVGLQAFIALAADSLPLPGGIGATESSFLILFSDIFTEDLVLPGMLLSRGITYYALIIMSATVTVIAHVISSRKNKIESGGI